MRTAGGGMFFADRRHKTFVDSRKAVRESLAIDMASSIPAGVGREAIIRMRASSRNVYSLGFLSPNRKKNRRKFGAKAGMPCMATMLDGGNCIMDVQSWNLLLPSPITASALQTEVSRKPLCGSGKSDSTTASVIDATSSIVNPNGTRNRKL